MSDYEKGLEKILVTGTAISEQISDGSNVNVIVAKEKYQCDVLNPFAMIFCEVLFNTIDDYKLGVQDIRTILRIIYYARFGNLIQMSYAKLAKDLGVKRPNLSRTMKKLKDAGVLIEDDGNLYLNPQVITKGSFAKIEEDRELELIEKGAKILAQTMNVEPNVVTKKMKDDIRKKEFEKRFRQGSLLDAFEPEDT